MWLNQWYGGSFELFHQRRGERCRQLVRADSPVSYLPGDTIRMIGREGLSTKDGIDNEQGRARG
jgi:hypothetical protein